MLILIWTIPAAIIVFLLALIFRRFMLSFLRIPHGMVLVLAVVGATAIAMAINASLLPSELASKIGAAVLIAALMVGSVLTAQKFRRPKKD